jgi:hypothetical protein
MLVHHSRELAEEEITENNRPAPHGAGIVVGSAGFASAIFIDLAFKVSYPAIPVEGAHLPA